MDHPGLNSQALTVHEGASSPASWVELAPVKPAFDLSIGSVLGICRRHIVMIGGVTVLAAVAAAAISSTLTPRYRAEAMVMLDTRVEHVSNLKGVVGTPFTTSDTAPVLRSEVQVLTSPELARKVIDKLDLANSPSFQSHPSLRGQVVGAVEDRVRSLCLQYLGLSACQPKPAVAEDPARVRIGLIGAYLSRLSVFNDGRSLTISVGFQDGDPKLAQQIVNTHVDTYLADQRAFKRQASANGVAWIDQQLGRMGAELANKQRDLLALRATAGLVTARGATVVAQQVADVSAQLIQARSDLAQRQARASGGQGAARQGGAGSQSDVIGSPLIQTLRGQESTAMQAYQDLLQTRGANFPGVLQAKARVDEIERRIASETARIVSANGSDVGVAQDRVAQLERTLASLRSQLTDQDQGAARVADLERDVAGTRAVYQGLLERQQELEAQAGTEDADARLISPAIEPLDPFFPNKTLLVSLGLLLGLVTSVGVAFVVDKPERGIKSPADLQDLVGALSFHPLPLVPEVRGRRTLADHLRDSPKGEFAEALRSLRGDIMALGRKKTVKVIALTSALPREGKSSVALSLARSMAASGLHVLLVDCDLRRSSLGRLTGVRPDGRGIVALLQGKCSLEDATVFDGRSSLSMLMVEGQSHAPQDLLAGPGFREMLAEARNAYDFVILDTPPQGAVSDPLVIAERADATIILVRWKSTPMNVLRWTLQAFYKRGLRPDGIFLNGVDYRHVTKQDVDFRTAYRSTRTYYLQS